jgi:hypothetical protein
MADLARRRVAAIATAGDPPTLAAKAATETIPIAFGVSGDPVGHGLIASLARPGGNAMGINFFTSEVLAKRLGLLHELVPKAVRVALLVNPTRPWPQGAGPQAAAPKSENPPGGRGSSSRAGACGPRSAHGVGPGLSVPASRSEEEHGAVLAPVAQPVEHRHPSPSQATASPSSRNERTWSAPAPSAISGYRSATHARCG